MNIADSKKTYNSADYRGLSDPERRIFKSVVEDLDERGLFHRSDTPIIASYARNIFLARLASADIQKYGVIIAEEDKYHGTKLRENPAVQLQNRCQKAAEETAIRLGLTPTGRRRLKGEERVTVEDPTDKWLQK